MTDELRERFEPLRRRHFERPEHEAELLRSLRERQRREPGRLRRWSIGLTIFAVGATAAVATQAALARWRVTFEEEGGEREILLEALSPGARPPLGTLRAEDGSLFRIERRDGRLVMRPLGSGAEGR